MGFWVGDFEFGVCVFFGILEFGKLDLGFGVWSVWNKILSLEFQVCRFGFGV